MCRKGSVVSARRLSARKMRYWLVADREEAVSLEPHHQRPERLGRASAGCWRMANSARLRRSQGAGQWSAVVQCAKPAVCTRVLGARQWGDVRRGRGRSLTVGVTELLVETWRCDHQPARSAADEAARGLQCPAPFEAYHPTSSSARGIDLGLRRLRDICWGCCWEENRHSRRDWWRLGTKRTENDDSAGD